MREIWFRGQRIFSKEWVEGYYYIREKGFFIMPPDGSDVVLPTLVRPETVGQYTGLRDKDGVRIFEGDIVDTDLKRPYLIVEFRDGCFMFNCNDGGEDYYDIMLPIVKEPHTEYKYGKVIGNIHDNQELLEGEQNEQ